MADEEGVLSALGLPILSVARLLLSHACMLGRPYGLLKNIVSKTGVSKSEQGLYVRGVKISTVTFSKKPKQKEKSKPLFYKETSSP